MSSRLLILTTASDTKVRIRRTSTHHPDALAAVVDGDRLIAERPEELPAPLKATTIIGIVVLA
jgi:hypothetical protein